MCRLIKLFLSIAFSFTLIAACHSVEVRKSSTSQVQSPECRVFQHRLGETCIPVNPQRIVALDPRYLADPLLALGIKPVGMAVYVEQGEEDLAGLTSDDIEEIEKVGDVYQPSLEKILSLKSDLILAMYFSHEKIYQQLTAIAPTLIVDFERNYSFKVNLRYLAQIFGKEEEAEKVISQYQARINQLRQKLDRNPEEIKVTLLLRYSGVFGMPHPEHTSHEIFSDIGLQDTINVARTNSVSLEVLPQYAPDILFIMDYENNPESFFLENPLIASLNAVKNNCVYFVDAETWSANGPIGVNRMLDELFKYLPVRSP